MSGPLVVVVALVLVLAASGPTVGAHHAISAVYDSGRQTTITGTITEFHFVNPHPWLLVEVPDPGGPAASWRLEMDNRGELAAVGVKGDTLKPGDRVVVSGSLARDQTKSLYVRRLDRPADGFRYEQVGTRPRVTQTR
jgi:hypothetical protein